MRNYGSMVLLSSLIVMSLFGAVFGLPYKSTFVENGKGVIWSQEYGIRSFYSVNSIGEGNNWLYQLQNPNISSILASDYKHVIIDYSRDGTEETAHTKEEISQLVDKGIVTLAYLSIGEAEDYRFYWYDGIEKASWLGIENENWAGNYKVRYWDKEWQKLVYAYLDEIIEAGYSGIYMDIVDGYYYWGELEYYGEERLWGDPKDTEEAAKRMIEFIGDLSAYAKEKNSNFLVASQNAVEIIDYDDQDVYIDSIDGLGIESLWYLETEKREAKEVERRLQYIRGYFKASKFVVVTDYVDDGSQSPDNLARMKEFINNCKKEGYNYFIGNRDRALDVLK